MKIKKLTAVFTAVVMALSMATAASAENTSNTFSANERVYLDDLPDGYDEAANFTEVEETYSARSVSLPLADYPNGSYYTKNGKACSGCHAWCNWNKLTNGDEQCNCIVFDSSSQCVAFAKYVYYKTRGTHWTTANRVYIDKDLDAASYKSYLMGKPAGTYIYCLTQRGNDHIMSIAETSSTGITIYDADYTGTDCVVRYKTFSWSTFASTYPHLVNYEV